MAVLGGSILVDKMPAATEGGRAIDVPSALVYDWRGTIFIPGVTLDRLIAGLEAAVPPQEDVLAASIVERAGDHLIVALRLRCTKVVTVVYDTVHVVRFDRLGPLRGTSASTAIRSAEVADVGTPREHDLSATDDHGYLWRWNSYWRYQQVDGGVVAECESLSLSRALPAMLFFLEPVITGTAKESMERTLRAVKRAYAGVGG